MNYYSVTKYCLDLKNEYLGEPKTKCFWHFRIQKRIKTGIGVGKYVRQDLQIVQKGLCKMIETWLTYALFSVSQNTLIGPMTHLESQLAVMILPIVWGEGLFHENNVNWSPANWQDDGFGGIKLIQTTHPLTYEDGCYN